jgi:hypothetical protein
LPLDIAFGLVGCVAEDVGQVLALLFSQVTEHVTKLTTTSASTSTHVVSDDDGSQQKK